MLEREGLADVAVRRLGLTCRTPDLTQWAAMVRRAKHPEGQVEIALVGKYVALHDAYLSVVEALTHGGIENGVSVKLRWVDSEAVTDGNAAEMLAGADGILVPGGLRGPGHRGNDLRHPVRREKNIPFFGICLGMQMAVIETARHVCGIADAQSGEFSQTTRHPVIALMPDQVGVTAKGGTHAPGFLSLPHHRGGHPGLPGLWHPGHRRAPPPPVRVQQPIPGGPGGRGTGALRPVPRRPFWWRWWSAGTTPGSWASSSTRS